MKQLSKHQVFQLWVIHMKIHWFLSGTEHAICVVLNNELIKCVHFKFFTLLYMKFHFSRNHRHCHLSLSVRHVTVLGKCTRIISLHKNSRGLIWATKYYWLVTEWGQKMVAISMIFLILIWYLWNDIKSSLGVRKSCKH